MAAQWLVTQKDNQFPVESLEELKRMAKGGRLSSGDMVQPPGATDWLYASEIPELKGLFSAEYDEGGSSGAGQTVMMLGVAAALLVVLVIGSALAAYTYSTLPTGDESLLGEGGLKYSEMLVTAGGAPLRAEPQAAAGSVVSLQKDQVLDLMAKRGEFYKAKTKDGQEGWVLVDQVIPMYQLGGKEARAEFDPLYNPDRYVEIGNAAWMLNPDDKAMKKTDFKFMMTNKAKYPMTDLRLLAIVKDGKGAELERVEFPVEGIIPGTAQGGSTFVGTLMPDEKDKEGVPRLLTEATFQEEAKTDPDMQLRWVDGVEVEMKTKDFALAEIQLMEVRAAPE
jgi:hypothetical protein